MILIDWIVNTGILDRWRATNSWIGRIVHRADLRALRSLVRQVKKQKDEDS